MVWDFDPVMVRFMGLTIHYYGVLFAIGIYIGYLLWHWQMTKHGFTEKQSEDFVLFGFLAVIIGSRLGHCLFYDPKMYLSNPIEIIKFWKGGLASHGATIALLLTLYLYHRVKKIPLWQLCDCFAMSAAVGAIAVRIGNFLNSEIVGRVTDVPWAMKFVRFERVALPRHPSQLYEIALGVIVLVVLLIADRHYKIKRPIALLSSLFLSCYFTGRFIVEFFKEYQVLPDTFPLTMGQILSIPFALGGYFLLYQASQHRLGEVEQNVVCEGDKPSPQNNDTTNNQTIQKTDQSKQNRHPQKGKKKSKHDKHK